MRWQFFFLTLSFLVSDTTFSQVKRDLPRSFQDPILKEIKAFYSPSEGQVEDLLKGEVFSFSKVSSPREKIQQMILFISGIHPRNCTRAMRKLSLYEHYSQYMDFVKQSRYDDLTQKITMTVDHTLLPFPMVLTFKIPRITKEGHYPFTFDHGFLKDLKGTVIVKEIGKFCLLGLKADWEGPETQIPNLPFEVFMQTVGKLGLEHLIRVSLF
jgi:hypothetical protein